MMCRVRWMAVSTGVLVLGLWLLGRDARTSAADDKELTAAILKLAGDAEKGNKDAVKKEAVALAKKTELEDLMHLFVLRSKKGLGVGLKAGAAMPDGIEKKIEVLAEKALPQKQLDDEATALEQMGWAAAALAEVTLAKVPEKDQGKKKIKDWVKWSEDMRDGATVLAAAAKTKKPADVHKAADKVNTACNKCHDVFRFDN